MGAFADFNLGEGIDGLEDLRFGEAGQRFLLGQIQACPAFKVGDPGVGRWRDSWDLIPDV